MSPKLRFSPLSLLLAAGLLTWAALPAVRADDGCAPAACSGGSCSGGSCGPTKAGLLGCHCQWTHFCCVKPPKICWHRVCANPICNTCELEHYGYWQTCWHPWPFPPDWSHCPVPPPEVAMFGGPTTAAPPTATEKTPSPRRDRIP